jgi:hypothetical protein
MINKNKKLIAGPWVGEFGYFLHTWQARLRWLAHNEYEEVVVICRPGQEYIFEDFASDIIIWDGSLPDTASGSGCRGFKFKDVYAEDGTDRVQPPQVIAPYNWRHKEQFSQAFKDQEFIVFGDEDSDEEGYDALFHIRSTTKLNQGYKNTFKYWDVLLKELGDVKVACIGLKEQADHLPGTVDKRSVQLKELSNIMRASKVLIGASSGPIHFAALCDLPHVTWVGRPIYDRAGSSRWRYEDHWNPFKVDVRFLYDRRWNPPLRLILKNAKSIIKGASK